MSNLKNINLSSTNLGVNGSGIYPIVNVADGVHITLPEGFIFYSADNPFQFFRCGHFISFNIIVKTDREIQPGNYEGTISFDNSVDSPYSTVVASSAYDKCPLNIQISGTMFRISTSQILKQNCIAVCQTLYLTRG